MLTQPKVRIGMVNFINTAPLYDVWLRTVNRPDWSVVEASPSALNRMLYADQLDMGLVSSQEYAVHPENYTGRLVLLSGQSQTSASLVKIILDNFYKVKPLYEIGPALEAGGNNNISGVLAIGDEALILAQQKMYPYKIDLGKIWHDMTTLPFVFAVWAIRSEFCRTNPDIVSEIHCELLRCRQEGTDDLKNISRRVSPRVSMDAAACYEYLRGIEHDLGPKKKKGLIRFIEYLIERGEGAVGALPLRLFSDIKR
jgi:chorismate dehydratase